MPERVIPTNTPSPLDDLAAVLAELRTAMARGRTVAGEPRPVAARLTEPAK